ncbi:MAG TPA: 30S ribosomal protein S6 [Campylobacteraceae bacterium]|nr:30S ribosomal protein S6 [Campylobacteraceae bacterium]
MRHYELLFVLKPTLTEEENKERFEHVRGILEKNGCEIASIDDMGVRKLAYEIDKHERGHYYVVYYKADPAVIDEILRNLRFTEEVIRFLNVKYTNKKEIENWEKLVKGTFNKKEEKPAAPAPKEETPAAEAKSEAPAEKAE